MTVPNAQLAAAPTMSSAPSGERPTACTSFPSKSSNPAQLWDQYVHLTEGEAVLRAVKSEVAIRPIWHQKDTRVQARIPAAFLGYGCRVRVGHTLKRVGSPLSPQQALHCLRGIKSGDILLETTDGRTPRLRRVSKLVASTANLARPRPRAVRCAAKHATQVLPN
jgi:hypothetical protein